MSPELQRRIRERSVICAPSGCTLWLGSHSDGRPTIGVGPQKSAYVARLLLGLVPGDPREVLHACDNPGCINVEHLRAGTHAENQADMKHKGRARGGHGSDGSWRNAQKTHCKHGHVFDEANTYVETRTDGSIRRQCRACRAALQRQRRQVSR